MQPALSFPQALEHRAGADGPFRLPQRNFVSASLHRAWACWPRAAISPHARFVLFTFSLAMGENGVNSSLPRCKTRKAGMIDALPDL